MDFNNVQTNEQEPEPIVIEQNDDTRTYHSLMPISVPTQKSQVNVPLQNLNYWPAPVPFSQLEVFNWNSPFENQFNWTSPVQAEQQNQQQLFQPLNWTAPVQQPIFRPQTWTSPVLIHALQPQSGTSPLQPPPQQQQQSQQLLQPFNMTPNGQSKTRDPLRTINENSIRLEMALSISNTYSQTFSGLTREDKSDIIRQVLLMQNSLKSKSKKPRYVLNRIDIFHYIVKTLYP